MGTLTTLTAGRTRRGYCVRVSGRGTMREGPALRTFASHVLEEPGGPALDVDLSDCDYLDSTFLGVLVVVLRGFKEAGTPDRLAIAGQADRLHRLLGPSHLDALLPLRGDRPERLGEEIPIPLQSLAPEELGRLILECHRRLAELGGDNEAAFGPIVDRLSRELDHDARPRMS